MKSKRVQALVLASALAAGYSGAAVFSAWAQPTVREATGYGPGDGLTRLVLTVGSDNPGPEFLAALEAVDGVVTAQRLDDGAVLAATEGLAPHQLEDVPGVSDAEFSVTVPVLGTASDPWVASHGWNLENTGTNVQGQSAAPDADVDAFTGYDGGTGDGLVVAVTDTGFDSDHPDLAGSLWINPAQACGAPDQDGNGFAGDCHGWNFATDSADIDNGTGGSHGTSVAGVVGARANNGAGTAGVAPTVSIMPLVIGTGGGVDVTLATQAIYYAVDNGADVINASWGGSFGGAPLDRLREAVAYAAAQDVLVVAAAGNDSLDRDTSIFYPASLTDANVVTVGSSTATDTIADHSAYGAGSVDLFAPGYKVFTTWNDGAYRLVDGTSIAAPHVAAAYALYRGAWPDATAAQLKQALLDDVDPLPAFAGKSVTGGRLSVASLADGVLGAVRYTFTSMTALEAGVVTPAVTATGEDATGDYSFTVGLGMEYQGEVWALSGQDITLGNTTLTTGDSGEVSFELGTADSLGDLDLSPAMELGDGRYVLTVQLHRDGDVLGRTFAAPVRVGAAANAPDDDPVIDDPVIDDPVIDDPATDDGTDDTGTAPDTDPGAGSDSPDSGSDGSGPGGPGDSGAGGPGDPGSGGSDTDTSGDSGSGDDGSGSDASSADDGSGTGGNDTEGPGGGPGSDDSGTDDPDIDDSDTGDSGGSDAPDDSDDSGTDDGPGIPPGGDDGVATFPGVGPFSITSMSPTTVDVSGGTLVTIRGNALPSDPRVRVGDSAAATVVSWSATSLTFRTPARAPGVYDVHVFALDDETYALEEALTYAEDVGSGAPGTDDSTDDSGGDDGADTDDPGPDTDGSDGPGDDDAADDGNSGGSAPPVVRTGPGGERLVRSATFAALGPIWSMDCSSSCSGVAI